MKTVIKDIEFYTDKKYPQTIKCRFSKIVGTMKIGYPGNSILGICHHPDDAKNLVKILNKLSTESKLSFFEQ